MLLFGTHTHAHTHTGTYVDTRACGRTLRDSDRYARENKREEIRPEQGRSAMLCLFFCCLEL